MRPHLARHLALTLAVALGATAVPAEPPARPSGVVVRQHDRHEPSGRRRPQPSVEVILPLEVDDPGLCADQGRYHSSARVQGLDRFELETDPLVPPATLGC
jgi:hypothetical protein